MAVGTFDPHAAANVPVSVSPAAVAHFRRQLDISKNARAVRLSVKESGCTGYMYVVDLVADIKDTDEVLALDEGVELAIDRDSLTVVRGTQIDLVTEGVNRQLRFSNPNTADQCGCGESFSVKQVS